MRNVRERLLKLLTPWYSEDDAKRRDESTDDVQRISVRARFRADAVLRSYDEADKRLGEMSGNSHK